MADIVTLTHRNVCKDGFTVTDTADAGTLFLFTVVLEDLASTSLFSPFSLLGSTSSLGSYRTCKIGTQGACALA
jgi:hypothetical protein